MKALLHLNSEEADKQSELLGNIKNLKEDESIETEKIAVVLNSDAVHMAKKKAGASEYVENHLDDGVEFKVCSNSLESRKIGKNILVEGVEVADSGVGAIMKLQEDGFNYLKI